MKNKDVTVYRKKNKDGEYVDTDSFDTLRYSFGDVGGGSESLVVIQLDASNPEIIKESETNTYLKGN